MSDDVNRTSVSGVFYACVWTDESSWSSEVKVSRSTSDLQPAKLEPVPQRFCSSSDPCVFLAGNAMVSAARLELQVLQSPSLGRRKRVDSRPAPAT